MIPLNSKLASELLSHAHRAMQSAYRDAEIKITKNKVAVTQREAWHVAQLCASIRLMAQDWRKSITASNPGVTLSMSSVFTHQKPYVQWPKLAKGNSRCELADLLIAVIDRRVNPAKGFAVLVQAKLSNDEQVSLTTPSEKKQFEVLSKRPKFDVDAKNGPVQVDLGSYAPDSALLYGIACVHGHVSGMYCIHCQHKTWVVADDLAHSTAKLITASDTFASTLVGLLEGSRGWEFTLPKSGQDWRVFNAIPRENWSLLINYLLEDTFKGSLSKRLQIPAGQATRGKEEQLFFVAKTQRNASMAFLTDGFNQLRQFASSNNDSVETPSWSPADLSETNGNGDGGDGMNSNFDEPEDGAISAIVIEVGTQG